MTNKLTCLLFTLLTAFYSTAQIDTMAFKTPEGVAEKFLEFISFEKDEVKDWDEFRNLFLPQAQMISINPKAPEARQICLKNIEEFPRYSGTTFPKEGFEEIVIGLDVN